MKEPPKIRLAVLVVSGMLFAACGGSSSHTIRGEVSALDTCPARGVSEGDPVLLRDGNNNTISTAELGAGKNTPLFGKAGGKQVREITDDLDLARCVYKFRFDDVPDEKFYSVEVGDTGDVTYSKAKLEKADWKVALSLT